MRNGFEGKEIAKELDISLRTVNYHKHEMYKKLGARNELDVVRIVGELRLVKDDELNFYPRKNGIKPKQATKKRNDKGRRLK
jgi:hypothetical protein